MTRRSAALVLFVGLSTACFASTMEGTSAEGSTTAAGTSISTTSAEATAGSTFSSAASSTSGSATSFGTSGTGSSGIGTGSVQGTTGGTSSGQLGYGSPCTAQLIAQLDFDDPCAAAGYACSGLFSQIGLDVPGSYSGTCTFPGDGFPCVASVGCGAGLSCGDNPIEGRSTCGVTCSSSSDCDLLSLTCQSGACQPTGCDLADAGLFGPCTIDGQPGECLEGHFSPVCQATGTATIGSACSDFRLNQSSFTPCGAGADCLYGSSTDQGYCYQEIYLDGGGCPPGTLLGVGSPTLLYGLCIQLCMGPDANTCPTGENCQSGPGVGGVFFGCSPG